MMMTKDSHDHVVQTPAPEKASETPFPVGLRVLAVDDNVVCLKLLARMLQECRYNVTVSTNATQALEMLRKNKEIYDIVITDVKMPDMDGYELLEIIGLEMDLPVIMMSASDDYESVMKGIEHGARDYLSKPVRLEELRNIWQHVFRKNRLSVKKGEIDQNQIPSKRQREKDKGKEENETTNTQIGGESCSQKKQRITWSAELHKKFVNAVQQLGTEAVPKKILELMNEPGLSRENVASHLQKYRNLLRKDREKASKSEQSDSHHFDSDRTNQNMPITSIASSSDKQAQNAINFNNMRPFGAPPMNSRPQFLPMNLQENRITTPPFADQIWQGMPIPVVGSVPQAPIFAANTYTQPVSNGVNFHAIYGRQQRFDDYVERLQSSLAGNNVQGRNMFGLNERGGLDIGGQTRFVDSPTGIGQTRLMNPPPDSLERESTSHHYSCSSPDDDLSIIVKQFSSNSTPKL